jgi:hypothetical protein
MRFYPDKWELAISGVNTHTRRPDATTEPYDNEAAARRAFAALLNQSSSFHITTAVIYAPAGSDRKPIILRKPGS